MRAAIAVLSRAAVPDASIAIPACLAGTLNAGAADKHHAREQLLAVLRAPGTAVGETMAILRMLAEAHGPVSLANLQAAGFHTDATLAVLVSAGLIRTVRGHPLSDAAHSQFGLAAQSIAFELEPCALEYLACCLHMPLPVVVHILPPATTNSGASTRTFARFIDSAMYPGTDSGLRRGEH